MGYKEEIAQEIREYRRPWQLSSLCAGIGLLIWGAKAIGAPDWDIPISLIMASLTYLFAPWSLRVILQRQWSRLPLALLLCWFSVDGCYWLYWSWQDPHALALMRSANAPASLSPYATCSGSIVVPCIKGFALCATHCTSNPKMVDTVNLYLSAARI